MYRVDPIYGCWLWTGPKDREGYGIHPGSRERAHRVVYRQERGDIPQGKVLDHLCRRRSCCNPDHLEPVTASVNERRKRWRTRAKMTKCPVGHDLFLHGRRTPQGGAVCLRCYRPPGGS